MSNFESVSIPSLAAGRGGQPSQFQSSFTTSTEEQREGAQPGTDKNYNAYSAYTTYNMYAEKEMTGAGAGGGPSRFEMSDQVPAPLMLQPTPVSQLPLPMPEVQPEVGTIESGQFEVHSRPGCIMCVFMLPFPFFCLGCCLSESCDIRFDDRTRTVTIRSWPGYLCCCKSKPVTVAYTDVANIVAIAGNMSINRQQAYSIYLVTKSGARHRMSDPDLISGIAAPMLTYHKFLFGRGNPSYHTPSPTSLILW